MTSAWPAELAWPHARGVLHRADALGPLTTSVPATHLSAADIALLGRTGTFACFCAKGLPS